ncbi:SDR family NAD(P)-dependent oxidoreductase [Terrimicrobium sacchariphilum]|nr:SDR family NAD(P)-dependent oxidoreductase [Terrimicrobium sacchariphilum]
MNKRWIVAGAGLVAALSVGGMISRRKRVGQFQGRVVVITGGSRGLGLALAREFGTRGALVALVARDEAELNRARADLSERGIRCAIYVCDLGSADPIRATVEAIISDHGKIDAVVNNAGMMLVAPFDLADDQDFKIAMDLHFWAPYHMIKAALPHLRKSQCPRIVNISSIGGHVAVPHMAPYAASKFALVGFSDALRAELASEGIRVTTVAPGLMRTGSHVNALFKGDTAGEYAWFATSASLPALSVSASRAARQIVDAAATGRGELTVGFAAKNARIFQGLLPRAVSVFAAMADRMLPHPSRTASHAPETGRESRSSRLPRAFTWLADRAIPRYNE